jgi:ADP-heptose:LPS heptosyltransferase
MDRGRLLMSERILAVHPGALGDVVLLGRLLERLEGEVTLVAGGEKAKLLEALGVAGRGLEFQSLAMEELFVEDLPETSRLAGQLGGPYDRLISAFAAGDLRAEGRLIALSGAGQGAFVPIRPEEGFDGHLLDLWSDLLGLPDVDQDAPAWEIPEQGQAQAMRLWGPGRIVIAPGSGGTFKCWPLERFEAVAEALQGRGDKPLFLLGPVELDTWPPKLVERLRRHWDLAGPVELMDLAALLSVSQGYIGNDSGVSHLAGAVGAATVAIFSPTRPEHFRPVGPRVRIVEGTTLESIEVDQVLEALDAFRH